MDECWCIRRIQCRNHYGISRRQLGNDQAVFWVVEIKYEASNSDNLAVITTWNRNGPTGSLQIYKSLWFNFSLKCESTDRTTRGSSLTPSISESFPTNCTPGDETAIQMIGDFHESIRLNCRIYAPRFSPSLAKSILMLKLFFSSSAQEQLAIVQEYLRWRCCCQWWFRNCVWCPIWSWRLICIWT